jgi:ferredoxin, 2Fe-2S
MNPKIRFLPAGKTIAIRRGDNLLWSAIKNRVAIRHRCGGKGSCKTCKVQILTKDVLLSAPSVKEVKMLGKEELANGFRLACQVRVYEAVEVKIPEETWKAKVKEQIELIKGKSEGNESEKG